MQMHGFSGLPLGESLPGSGSGDWFPTSSTAGTGPHRPSKTIGTIAELEKRPDSIQLFSPSSETAAMSDPILGGELVIRVIDAQVCASSLSLLPGQIYKTQVLMFIATPSLCMASLARSLVEVPF